MKTRLSFVLLLILLSTCKKDDEFNIDAIPGEYTGSIYYFPSVSGGGAGENDPALSGDIKTSITRDGSNFVLSFDKTFIYAIPDVSIKISYFMNSNVAAITTLEGQPYSSSSALGHLPDNPANYFSIDKYVHRVDCKLTLRSNDPDSTYYLLFMLLRIY